MSDSYPDAPEAVALELMRMIETAEEKSGRRDQRSNLTERVRPARPLQGLPIGGHRHGLQRPTSGPSALSLPSISPARRNPGGAL
jgi:hypothetical protein